MLARILEGDGSADTGDRIGVRLGHAKQCRPGGHNEALCSRAAAALAAAGEGDARRNASATAATGSEQRKPRQSPEVGDFKGRFAWIAGSEEWISVAKSHMAVSIELR